MGPIRLDNNGTGDSTDGGDKRFQVWGRSFVIHMLWNGLLFVLFAGAKVRELARVGWLMAEKRP